MITLRVCGDAETIVNDIDGMSHIIHYYGGSGLSRVAN